MPNTSVRAAAEGMPNINRRRLLNLTGAGLALAATAMARSHLSPHLPARLPNSKPHSMPNGQRSAPWSRR
jgi:hypothetical protein